MADDEAEFEDENMCPPGTYVYIMW